MHQKQRQMSETFRLGALLTVVGGFLDTYTYLSRGGVFANAQTGNIVLLALTAAVLCGPGAVRTDTTLIAVPAAILLPFLFVRIHRAIVWPLYLILLAFTLISSILQ